MGDQVDTIKYDIEQGNFISAGIHAVHLLVMIFYIMAQCFTGETLVVTEDGLVAIEDIEVGNYVLAEDTVTGEQEYKEVLNVFVSQTNKLVHVTTKDDDSDTTINTTDNHPFYVEGKGWVPAIELETGDVLRTVDGEIEVVSKVDIEYLEDAVLIYNLEIEGYHTYYVSDENVLVHNTYKSSDGGDTGTTGAENGNNSNEIKLPKESTYEGARNTLLAEIDNTGAFKNGSDKYICRLEMSYGYGKQIGRQSFDGKVRWRLDYDDKTGVHFNFENFTNGKGANAIKIVIPIDISQEAYKKNNRFMELGENKYE